ncbi:glycosyltransferase, partial [Salmonella enterica]
MCDSAKSFSVLMSLYYKESPVYLEACFASLANQSLLPAEIICVFDGPLSAELEDVVSKWSGSLNINIVRIPVNVGLGSALNKGLAQCSFNIVARMDTDDICHKDRFLKQISYLQQHPEVGLLSSTIGEFKNSINNVYAFRKLPLTHQEILRFVKKRNAFNHMAVVFKKDLVISAGGYQHEYLYEDYALWMRMIQNGVITANLSDVLVFARTGNGMSARRAGLKYAKSEFSVQVDFYKKGYLTFPELIKNLLIRLPFRLLPVPLLSILYSTIL